MTATTTLGILTALTLASCGCDDETCGSYEDQILAEVQAGENGKEAAKLPPQYWSNGDGTGTPQPCGDPGDLSTAYGHYRGPCADLAACLDGERCE